ncbi:hypothetical protein P7C71_g2459, partial [Lecanoromycetidae sp. Uapishka_2]
MPLELREHKLDDDWNELIQCESESFSDPFNTIFTLFRPERGTSGKARESFKELRDRAISHYKDDPTSIWLKVVDTDIGDKIVGAAEWNKFVENPYTKRLDHPMEATWFPEGEDREFANKLLDDWLVPRQQTMNRPHMLIALLFVHPEHRRRGVARMLLDWGTRKADELGIEAFVEATDAGKPCYESSGFVYMHTIYLNPTRRNPSKRWKELCALFQTPVHAYLMWRPKGGSFEEGRTVIPWEKKS